MPARPPFGLPAELAELHDEYALLGELGRGGAAVVYRALDRTLGREVAVKVVYPRPTSPDDDPVARLAREARLVAQLQHPNIVAVYAVRRLRGGGLALIMQLVAGGTLKHAVQADGPIAPERVEAVLRDVAGALAYAHARGLVHRDVKPENIFLDDTSGRALLADFGIARSADADSMTMTGTAVGTPFYMSPEQVDGGIIDGRSDLYSLGLVAWEALTGRRPWDGESLYNVIYKQKFEELPPIEALRPDVPRRLQYLVERMLQKHPGARWAGAEGLLAQLDHAVLPGDYARWQRALTARVVRFHAAEAERAQECAQERAGGDGAEPLASASTLHFIPGAPRGGGPVLAATPVRAAGSARPWVPGPATGLPVDVATRPQTAALDAPSAEPGTSVALRPPVAYAPPDAPSPVVYSDAVAPSWADADDTPVDAVAPRRRRPLAVLGAALGIAALGGGFAYDLVPGGAPDVRALGIAGTPGPLARTRPAERSGAAGGRTAALASRGPEAGGTGALLAGALLAAGGRHTCALTLGGGTECWGANDRGQLGDGGLPVRRPAPVSVTGALSFQALAAGLAHTCALTRLGDVYCWGANTRGQLGDATTVRRNAPVRVAGPAVYTALAAGSAHTCAITTDGGVRCWGANDQGQLGDGARTARVLPTAVPLPAPASLVAAGGQHTCAVTDAGQLYCWGANADGQLGVGTRGSFAPAPQLVRLPGRVVSLGLGAAHGCAATADGALWCWGRNDAGQVGDRTRTSRPAPIRVSLGASRVAVAVASGAAHTCVLTADGALACWGRNRRGAVGDGTQANRPSPALIALPARVTAVAAGTGHTCAVTVAGATLCWGDNMDGQLGDSTVTPRPRPASVRFAAGILARTAPSTVVQR